MKVTTKEFDERQSVNGGDLAQPFQGCKCTEPQTQGSLASSATLGFETESLWDTTQAHNAPRPEAVLRNAGGLLMRFCLAATCVFLFGGSAMAQADDAVDPNATNTAQGTNQSAVNVEEPDSAKESKHETSDLDWDWDWERKGGNGIRRETVVAIRKNAELKADDWSEMVVAVGGSATALGKVRDVVVAVAGDVDVQNRADQAVAVLGQVTAGPEAKIRRDVVAVFGDVKIKKGAHIGGDVVSVFGKADVENGAVVDGRVTELDFGTFRLGWLRGWFTHCLLLMRPLAPQVGWVWVIAL